MKRQICRFLPPFFLTGEGLTLGVVVQSPQELTSKSCRRVQLPLISLKMGGGGHTGTKRSGDVAEHAVSSALQPSHVGF